MTQEPSALDTILNNDQSGSSQPEAPIQGNSQEPQNNGSGQDPNAQPENQPGANTGEPPLPKDNESGFVPLKALEDERGKRQALETSVSDLKEQLEQLKTTTQRPDESVDQAPDPILDPEEYVTHQQKLVQQQLFEQSVVQSQAMAKQLYTDYEEKETAFLQAAERDPALNMQLRQSAAPAFYAYEKGKEILDLQKFRNTDPAALKEQVKAELMAELEKNGQLKPSANSQPPSSLADEPSALARNESKWDGPTPLEEILK